MKNKVIILMIFMFSCQADQSQSDLINKVIRDNFGDKEINTLNVRLKDWIANMRKYCMPSVASFAFDEYRVLSPILIRSDSRRAVAIIVSASDVSTTKSLKYSVEWIRCFKYLDQWYFFTISEAMYLPTSLNNANWTRIENYARNEMKGYIKYDLFQGSYVIDDNWFLNYFDNQDFLKEADRFKDHSEIEELTEKYWIPRYMRFHISRKRAIEKIDEFRKKEDLAKINGRYTQVEWDEIMKLREPKSNKDWDEIANFMRSLRDDPYIRDALNWKYGDPVE